MDKTDQPQKILTNNDNVDILLQPNPKSSFKFNPLYLVPKGNGNPMYKMFQNQNMKDFKIRDDFGHKIMLHKLILSSNPNICAKIHKILTEKQDTSEYVFKFEVSQEVLNAIFYYVYFDEDNSAVSFENTFNLLKVSIDLEDLTLTQKVITYINLKDKEKFEEFSKPENIYFLGYNLNEFFFYIKDILITKPNNKKEDYFQMFIIFCDEILSVLDQILSEKNFKEYLNSLSRVLESQIKNEISSNSLLEDTQKFVMKQTKIHKNQKVEFLCLYIRFKNFGSDPNIKKAEYLEKNLKGIFLREDLELEDIISYEESAKKLNIFNEQQVEKMKKEVILKGHSSAKLIREELFEQNRQIRDLTNGIGEMRIKNIALEKKITEYEKQVNLLETFCSNQAARIKALGGI